MKINLTSNFDLGMESIKLDDRASARDLLTRLSALVPGNLTFIDPKTSDVDDFFVVSVNGQEIPFLSDRLDTELKEGDEVQVAVVVFGGGCW